MTTEHMVILERIERKLDRILSELQPARLHERTDLLTLSEFVRLASQEGHEISLGGLRTYLYRHPDLRKSACQQSGKGRSKPQWMIRPADYFGYVTKK